MTTRRTILPVVRKVHRDELDEQLEHGAQPEIGANTPLAHRAAQLRRRATRNTLAAALEGTQWILHAASQDLPCLAEVNLRPGSLFDTELAGRLLGYPRVGLATLVEVIMGQSMRKEHSAVDWSKRPLPKPWLEYAALDVGRDGLDGLGHHAVAGRVADDRHDLQNRNSRADELRKRA